MTIRFGTDGWRAIVAEDYTFQNVRLCAQGVSDMIKEKSTGSRTLVVGYDTRFMSENFAEAVAEVSAANGIKTLLAHHAAPTPVLSHGVVSSGAEGGIVITASHNPPQWNGFKYKPYYGGSASPEVVRELEKHISKAEASGNINRISIAKAKSNGLVKHFDPKPGYLKHIATMIDLDAIRGAGLRVVVDSMWGTGSGYLATILAGGSTTITELRNERNPAFPGMSQPEPTAHNLNPLISSVVKTSADLGLATDGDSDRLGLVDERGRFITTLETFALLCLHQLENLGKRGSLIRSVTMTSMVDRLAELYGVSVFVTPVGFKFLGPVMIREDALLAGEESGGYAFQGNIPERDGVLSGLMVLEMLVKTGKSVSELLGLLSDKVGPHHYNRLDLPIEKKQSDLIYQKVASARPSTLAGRVVKKISNEDGFRFVLEDGYWVLVRFSGTEPLLRIYAEGESTDEVEALLTEMRSMTGL